MKVVYKKDDTNAFNSKFITINLKNPNNLEILKAEFRCGSIFKTFENPQFPIDISLKADETNMLKYTNTCYLAIYDIYNRKRTLEGSLTFKAKDAVV